MYTEFSISSQLTSSVAFVSSAEAMAPTTALAFCRAPADVVEAIDSFRRQRTARKALPRDRMGLDLWQRRVISLRAKVAYTGRFDVELPPYPTCRDAAREEGGPWRHQAHTEVCFAWFKEHYDL